LLHFYLPCNTVIGAAIHELRRRKKKAQVTRRGLQTPSKHRSQCMLAIWQQARPANLSNKIDRGDEQGIDVLLMVQTALAISRHEVLVFTLRK
jgi:hypothetical protein